MSVLRVIFNVFQFNRTNWKAVSLCFVAAVVFWIFSALNKDYKTNLRFPVRFEFDRDRFIPVDPLPENVAMNVSGNGWDLFRKSLGFRLPPLVISLDRPTEVKKVVGSTLPALLAGQLGSLQINYVVTDTLYVHIDPIDAHRFKVVVDTSAITFKSGYGRMSPIVVLPDSVELEGPRSILHELPDSISVRIPEQRMSQNYKEEVEVMVPHSELIKRNPPTVEVIFEVGEWIEVAGSVRLELINPPVNKGVSLVKDSISCSFRVPKREEENFRAALNNVVAELDVAGIGKGETRLLPKVSGLPRYAKLLRADSIAIKLY